MEGMQCTYLKDFSRKLDFLSGFTRSDTNWSVHLQQISRGLEFQAFKILL